MVLGKLTVPERPTNSVDSGPTALAIGAEGDGMDFFLSSITSFLSLSLSLSGRRPDIY